ncbi:hypothetical protein HORM4_180014 [Vibrio harveyi]|nr:hypothetical protein HORM4_180014 [Vibrio harveyi]
MMHIAASLMASTITPRNPKTNPKTVNLMSSKSMTLCDLEHSNTSDSNDANVCLSFQNKISKAN